MAHRYSMRKERGKCTRKCRNCTRNEPLKLFTLGGVFFARKEEGETSTREKTQEGWGLSGWWHSRSKAYAGENSCNDVNISKENTETEENNEGKGAGEEKCVACPGGNVNEDHVTPPRSILDRVKSISSSKKRQIPSIPCEGPMSHMLSDSCLFEEKKTERRRAVTFSTQVSVVLIPHKKEISAEDKNILWWNTAESNEFRKRLIELLPVGTDLTRSLMALGRMCTDLVELEDVIQIEATDNSELVSPEPFEEKNTTSCTWGGEEKTHEILPPVPQMNTKCSSPPEMCGASNTSNGDTAKGTWHGVNSYFDCEPISAPISINC